MAGSGDLLVKLLLNSNGFDNGIKKSKKQVSDFEKAGQEMGKKLVTSFGQIAGAMMAIKGAGDAFKAIINSSQTIGDAFASTMSTAKTVTDNFIYALANADFSTFNNGLDDMISKAREAHAAMDQLGNTRMSVDFLQATSGSEYKKAMANARNKALSEEERRQWLDVAKQELQNLTEGQQTLARDATTAIKSQLAAKTGISKYFVSEDAINKALLMDTRSTNVQEREQLQQDYKDFNAKIAAVIREAEERNTVTTTSLMGGTVVTRSKNYDAEMAKARELVEQMKRDNADMLVMYEILFRETDAGLQELYNTAKSAVAAQNQVAEMMTSTNEVSTSIDNEAKAINAATQKLQEERIALEQEQQALYDAAMKFDTGIVMGVKFDNSDIDKDYKLGQLVSGKPVEEYRKADPLADLPKTIAMLDESALPATAFGSDEQTETFMTNIESMTSGVEGLNSAFSAFGGVIGEDNTQMLTFIDNILQSAMAITTFISQTVAEIAIRKKNKAEAIGEAAAKTMSAHSSIPFAGIAAGIAAVSAIIATIQSIPKFANGGIVTSATLGVFGEAGPEAVMPLDRLNDFVRDREVRVTGKIVGQGKDLSVIIDNYNKVRNVKS